MKVFRDTFIHRVVLENGTEFRLGDEIEDDNGMGILVEIEPDHRWGISYLHLHLWNQGIGWLKTIVLN